MKRNFRQIHLVDKCCTSLLILNRKKGTNYSFFFVFSTFYVTTCSEMYEKFSEDMYGTTYKRVLLVNVMIEGLTER